MGVIIFLGDSITDSNRISSDNKLGFGYVNVFASALAKKQNSWTIFNQGVDGYVTEQVASNLHRDCIALHPDYVSILTGINDIGLIVEADASEQDKLYMLEDSIRAYHEMLFDLSRKSHAVVITLEPFIFSKDGKYDEWIPWQQKMSKNIKKLARNYNAKFVPLQEPLNQKVAELGLEAISLDGIHLTEEGQKVLADIILAAFEL